MEGGDDFLPLSKPPSLRERRLATSLLFSRLIHHPQAEVGQFDSDDHKAPDQRCAADAFAARLPTGAPPDRSARAGEGRKAATKRALHRQQKDFAKKWPYASARQDYARHQMMGESHARCPHNRVSRRPDAQRLFQVARGPIALLETHRGEVSVDHDLGMVSGPSSHNLMRRRTLARRQQFTHDLIGVIACLAHRLVRITHLIKRSEPAGHCAVGHTTI